MYELNTIITGDAQDLARDIPDDSVDMIFTNPPYLRKDLPLYSWLGQEARRVLKPGGWLFAHGAGEHLPDHLARLGEHLDYFWVFALLHRAGKPRLWHKRLMSGYKPVMAYTKGKPTPNSWMATVQIDERDKRYHDWGQGEGMFMKVISLLTEPGDLVWEPFCGGGTVPAVCKKLGRDFIAFEIDPETASDARRRLLNTQPPLFVTSPTQGILL